MKNIFIITGTSSGLGKAFVDLLLYQSEILIISISRNLHSDHINIDKNKVIQITADLSSCNISILIENIKEVVPVNSTIYFINNAFSIKPICKIESLEEDQISLNLRTNIFFPVIFISTLLNSFSNHELRILNITSGAATRPIENWSLYCSCKSFLNMFFKVLETEIKSNVLIYNIEPGVIDTNMQRIIRDSEFPESEYFKNLKIENKLKSPNEVVYQILKTIHFLK